MKLNIALILMGSLLIEGCGKTEDAGVPSPVESAGVSAPVVEIEAEPVVTEPAGSQPAEADVQAVSKVRYYEVPGCPLCVNIKAAMTDLEESFGGEVEFETVKASDEKLQEMKQWQLGSHGLVGFTPEGDSKVTIPGHNWGATKESARAAVEQKINELLGKSEPGQIAPETLEGDSPGHSHGDHGHKH